MYRFQLNLLFVLVLFQLGDADQTHFQRSPEAKKDYLKSALFADSRTVQKRNLIQFGLMVTCTTGRLALDYNNYGNYCGIGGSGTPVDNIDRCCQVHDNCFNRNDDCSPYWISYDSGFIKQWRSSSKKCVIKCDDTDKCKYNICECDRIAAECFAKYRYNRRHKKSGWWGKRRR